MAIPATNEIHGWMRNQIAISRREQEAGTIVSTRIIGYDVREIPEKCFVGTWVVVAVTEQTRQDGQISTIENVVADSYRTEEQATAKAIKLIAKAGL